LDWKVVPVEGKGLGVIALRPLPPKYRLMVDACQLTPTSHPAINDLLPKDGSPESKFDLNSLVAEAEEGEAEVSAVICLRICRVNHSCASNAAHVYAPDFKVKVRANKYEFAESYVDCPTVHNSAKFIVATVHELHELGTMNCRATNTYLSASQRVPISDECYRVNITYYCSPMPIPSLPFVIYK
jgi:hypothetical protein